LVGNFKNAGTKWDRTPTLAWISTKLIPPKIWALFELQLQNRIKAAVCARIDSSHICFARWPESELVRLLYN